MTFASPSEKFIPLVPNDGRASEQSMKLAGGKKSWVKPAVRQLDGNERERAVELIEQE